MAKEITNMRVKENAKKTMFAIMLLTIVFFMTVPVHAANRYIASISRTPISVYVGNSVTIALKNPAKGEKVSWVSENPRIASVSKTGKVAGKQIGKVKIKARSKSRSYTYIVNVKSKPKINYTSKRVEIGDSFKLKLLNTVGGRSWVSSNKKIATVSSSGNVTGCNVGIVKISTKYEGITYACKVTVKKSSKNLVRKAAPMANECVLKAFEDLDFKLIYDGSVSYAGYFSALNQSITLQGVDDTVYHELGHFLAWIAGNVDKRSEFATIYKSEKEKYTGIRKAYVTQNASEYFAESYRDYILSGSNLKKSRPKTYAYVRNAVQTIQNSPDRITKIKNVYKVIWKKNG